MLPGPLMLTHIVRHILRMPRPTNFKLGIRMEDDDPYQPQAPWPQRSGSQGHIICLSRVGPIAHKSKTNSRSITKIDRRVPHGCADGGHRDVDPHQRQAPWPARLKVKVTRSHGMSDPCGSYYEICTWYSDYQDAYDRQSRWPPRSKVRVITSHRMYISSLPLLNLGNKMLYLCH